MANFSPITLIIVMASIARIVYSVPLNSFIQEHSYGKKMDVNWKSIYTLPTSATNVATLQPTNASPLMEFKDVRKRFDPNLFRSIYDNTTKHSIGDLVPQHTQTLTNTHYEENKGTQRYNTFINIFYRSAAFIGVMLLFIIVVISGQRFNIAHIGRIVLHK